MKVHKLTQLAALSVALCSASSFAATNNDALLDLLVQKGVLTSAEATTVAEELEASQPVFVTAKGKAVEGIKLTGRLQFQYDAIGNDGSHADNGGNFSSQDGFYFRRVFLGAEAQFKNDWYGKIVADFGGSDSSVDLDEAIIGWKYDPMLQLKGGYTKASFGYYETTSSSKIKTVERSIANRFFVEDKGLQFGGRYTGIFANGELPAGFTYAASVASSTDSNDRTDRVTDDSNNLAVFGRLEWTSEEGDYGQFMVGTDLGFKQNGSTEAYAANQGGDGNMFAYGMHGKYTVGDFNLTGEVLGTTIENVVVNNGKDTDVFGLTVIPSYMLTDQWEIVAAYSYIDTDDTNILYADDLVRRSNVKAYYSEGESYYVGFNYYIIGNDLKLTGGYEYSTFQSSNNGTDDTDIDAFRLRLQMLF
jgi:phosphate-selective porin